MSTEELDIFSRHSGLVDAERLKHTVVDIVGCGGIGSWTALTLAKLGVGTIRIHDMDEVGAENVGTQLFGPEDIGEPKASATARLIERLSGVLVEPSDEELTVDFEPQPSNVAILAVDSIRTRAKLYRSFKSATELVIDPRMGGTSTCVWVVDPSLEHDLKEGLFTDRAEPIPCTRKAAMFTTQGTAASIANIVTAWAADEPLPRRIVNDYSGFLQGVSYGETE